MADTKSTELSEISVPSLEDLAYLVDDPGGTPVSNKCTLSRLGGLLLAPVCDGRLTLESGVPVSTSDQTAKTNVYFTPYLGNRVAIYDGTRWRLYTFTELTLALGTLTSGKNYDVFIYDNAGTLTVELSAAWTNDTTRAEALAIQDGVYVKDGATTRRYLGTIRTVSTTTTEDRLTNRCVWNACNRTRRPVRGVETASTWNYSTATWRGMNGDTEARVGVVVGLVGSMAEIHAHGYCNSSDSGGSTRSIAVGVGVNSTSVNSAHLYGGGLGNGESAGHGSETHAMLWHTPGIGYTFYQALEWARALETVSWFGTLDTASNQLAAGVAGYVEG